MSNRLFQGVIHQMRETIHHTLGVIDSAGTIISCSELGRIGETLVGITESLFTDHETITAGDYLLRAIGTQMHA